MSHGPPDPTRPDPTRSSYGTTTGGGATDSTEPSAKTSRKRSSTPLPDDFEPNDTNRRLAAERGLDLTAVVEHWRDYHLAKDSRFVDWHRALNTWLRNETPKPTAATAAPRLTPVTDLETPPDGLTDAEYDAWLRRRRA